MEQSVFSRESNFPTGTQKQLQLCPFRLHTDAFYFFFPAKVSVMRCSFGSKSEMVKG